MLDLLVLLKQIGSSNLEGDLKNKLKETILSLHKEYGPNHLVDFAERVVFDPKSYDLRFPVELGKLVYLNYLGWLYYKTRAKEYLDAIKKYTSSTDEKFSIAAKASLKRLEEKLEIS